MLFFWVLQFLLSVFLYCTYWHLCGLFTTCCFLSLQRPFLIATSCLLKCYMEDMDMAFQFKISGQSVLFAWFTWQLGFPGGTGGKEPTWQCKRPGLNPWVRKILWRRKWQPNPIFLPGESHGQRRLVDYSPWGRNSQTGLSTQIEEIIRINNFRIIRCKKKWTDVKSKHCKR